MQKETTVDVVTFGCRLNAYESEIIKKHAETAGLKDAIIFNTCAVTAEAERQARQAIRKAKRTFPHKKIIVTGCAAQIRAEHFLKMEEVDQVLGNKEKLEAINFSPEKKEKLLLTDIMEVKETTPHLVVGFDGKTRAFVEVQNGCNHRCTFCTIPFGRGNSRSIPPSLIIEQTRHFVREGYKEIVITGVDITSYGEDLTPATTLGQMLKELMTAIPELPRLRLSSVDPAEIDEDVFDLFANEPRFMPHFHISLQAGDDLILQRMKRRHLRHHIISFCKRARSLRPDVVFGADIIAGFPTETEERFENTRRIIEECGITYVHVFPYSPRPGTPAARMPQVARPTIKERARILRDEGEKALKRYFSLQVGKEAYVLIEENGARTEHFAPISLNKNSKPRHLIKAKITGCDDTSLKGEVL